MTARSCDSTLCPNCTTEYVECRDGTCHACDDLYSGGQVSVPRDAIAAAPMDLTSDGSGVLLGPREQLQVHVWLQQCLAVLDVPLEERDQMKQLAHDLAVAVEHKIRLGNAALVHLVGVPGGMCAVELEPSGAGRLCWRRFGHQHDDLQFGSRHTCLPLVEDWFSIWPLRGDA